MSNYTGKGELLVSVAGSVLPSGGTPVAGQLAATTTGQALGASTACRQVVIQSDPANTTNVLLGDATNQYVSLTPGATITVPTSNVNLIYAKMASLTGNVNWILVA